MIAGAGGGLVASVATCPLDVIKTKLQAQQVKSGHHSYLGIVDTVKNILRYDGIRGMYRGLGPTVLGYLPTWAIYFAVYDGIKNHFGRRLDEEASAARRVYPAAQVKGYQPLNREHPWTLHLFSAMAAGATSTLCTNPLWVIKTRFMTQSRDEQRYKHTLDAAITIYRTEGWRAFFRGLFPSLLGITHVAVQFPLYEALKKWASNGSPDALTSAQILGCSSTAKMTASIATYPHEVLRTRLQTYRRLKGPTEIPGGGDSSGRVPGVVRMAKIIIRNEGGSALYRGLSVNLVRTVPNSAVTMLTYEMLMRYLTARTAHPP